MAQPHVAQFQALRYFALDGTDHATCAELASMSRDLRSRSRSRSRRSAWQLHSRHSHFVGFSHDEFTFHHQRLSSAHRMDHLNDATHSFVRNRDH